MARKNNTFEQVLRELETEVERLESGDLPLDEALTCFENGVKAAGRCQVLLDDAELKIEQLSKSSGGKFTLSTLATPDKQDGE